MKWRLQTTTDISGCVLGTGSYLNGTGVLEGNTTSGFFQVIDSIHTGAYETASTLLSAITPGSMCRENYLFVLDTYLIGIDSTGHFTLSGRIRTGSQIPC